MKNHNPNNEYGLQQFTPPTGVAKTKANRLDAYFPDQASREAYEAATKVNEVEKARHVFDSEVESVADLLAGSYSSIMHHTEGIGWSVGRNSVPKVTSVQLRGLSSMSIVDAVRLGILSSRGVDAHVYWRAVQRHLRPEQAAQEAFDMEVESAAAMLASGSYPHMEYVEALERTPSYVSPTVVISVQFSGLASISVADAVRRGILSSRGVELAGYRRALNLGFLPSHSELDEHGFPKGK